MHSFRTRQHVDPPPVHKPDPSSRPIVSDRTIVLALGVPIGRDGLPLMGAFARAEVPLEHVPYLVPFVATLTAVNLSHKPIAIYYLPNHPTFVPSHARCTLNDLSDIPFLQRVLDVPVLTSLTLYIPAFGSETTYFPPRSVTKPLLSAPRLTLFFLDGELPCLYQLLSALSVPSVTMLKLHFKRLHRDITFTNAAFTRPLSTSSHGTLTTVVLVEESAHSRFGILQFGAAVWPLFILPQIMNFELHVKASPLALMDYDLGRVAGAWSRLRHFAVHTYRECVAPIPSLDALLRFQKECPGLDTLWLPQLDLKLNSSQAPDRPLASGGQCTSPSMDTHQRATEPVSIGADAGVGQPITIGADAHGGQTPGLCGVVYDKKSEPAVHREPFRFGSHRAGPFEHRVDPSDVVGVADVVARAHSAAGHPLCALKISSHTDKYVAVGPERFRELGRRIDELFPNVVFSEPDVPLVSTGSVTDWGMLWVAVLNAKLMRVMQAWPPF